MADTIDFRRYRTGEAARVLHTLGAPRSTFTLRKDHAFQPGERGPIFVRDDRGHCWYFHTALEAWAEGERAKLSPNNPPPPAFMRCHA
jgi:hypothetical protein